MVVAVRPGNVRFTVYVQVPRAMASSNARVAATTKHLTRNLGKIKIYSDSPLRVLIDNHERRCGRGLQKAGKPVAVDRVRNGVFYL